MRRIIIIFILVLGISVNASAEWPEGGIRWGSGFHWPWHQWAVVPDNQGGMFGVWLDADWDFRIQHVDNEGNLMFEYPGVKIIDDPDSQVEPIACSDRQGGIVFAWKEYRNHGWNDIYLQRVGSDGNEIWEHNGVPVIVDPDRETYDYRLESLSNSMTIVVWNHVTGILSSEIHAQLLDTLGNIQWDSAGMIISDGGENGYVRHPYVSIDSLDHIYVTWMDKSDDSLNGGVYAQKIDIEGNTYWGENGARICYGDIGDFSRYYDATVDGNGGIFVVWRDFRSNIRYNIFTAWMDSLGTSQWGLEGIRVHQLDGADFPLIEYDNINGAFISWANEGDQHVQWIKRGPADDALRWGENGKAVILDYSRKPISLYDVGNGEWILNTYGQGIGVSQKFDTTGSYHWGDTGKQVWDTIEDYDGVPDGEGGVIVLKVSVSTYFAQRIYWDGHYEGETSIFDDYDENIPSTYILHNPYPNPFNSSTTIKYTIPFLEPEKSIAFYNLLGQRIDELPIPNENLNSSAIWDASEFSSGIYFARLNGAHASNVVKLVLMK